MTNVVSVQDAIDLFKTIISTATDDVDMITAAGNVNFPEDGQQDVCGAFRTVSSYCNEQNPLKQPQLIQRRHSL